MELLTTTTDAINNCNQYTICMGLLNLYRVFDTVNNTQSGVKLEHYEIRGVALELFNNYLLSETEIINITQQNQTG